MDIYKLQDKSIVAWQKNDPGNRMTIRLIKKILKERGITGRILDLGCGTGQLAMALAKEGYKVAGADYSKKVVKIASELAKEEGLKIKFKVADAEKFVQKEAFDVIICSETLEHLKHDQKVVDNIYKSLSKKGLVILTGPHDMNQWRELDVYHQHYRRYSIEDVEKLLEKFEVEDIFTRGFPTIRLVDIIFDKFSKMKKKTGDSPTYGTIWQNKTKTFIISNIIFPLMYYVSMIDNLFNHMNKGTNYIAVARKQK